MSEQLEPFRLAMAMAHDVATRLSEKEMTHGLQKHEVLLHAQACRTLQGFLRLSEINVDQVIEGDTADERGADRS